MKEVIEKLDTIEAASVAKIEEVKAEVATTVEAAKAEFAEKVANLEAKISEVQAPAIVKAYKSLGLLKNKFAISTSLVAAQKKKSNCLNQQINMMRT